MYTSQIEIEGRKGDELKMEPFFPDFVSTERLNYITNGTHTSVHIQVMQASMGIL